MKESMEKTLYLVRHAKSSWDYPHLDDIDRPLNKRGKKDAPEMGRRLSESGIFPDLIISSPAERAYKTSREIAKKLDFPKKAIQIEEDVYHASEDILLQVINRCDNLWKTIMIIGHNPGFTDFANSIANQNIDNIPTCGIFGCTFKTNNWTDINFGMGEKILFDYPKKEFKQKK